MRQGEKILDTLADIAGIESIPLPGRLLVEINDQKRVLIENHLGVIAYCCHKVIVKVHCGFMCIYGDDLYIHKMSREQLVITGRIDAVNFRERC